MHILELNNIEKKFPLSENFSIDKSNIEPIHKKEQFKALENINLTVNNSEIIGVIGRNGSGKTTLLKVIAKIIPPTKGEIKVNGKVAGLFTLGAGFQNQLSGRENIYINGSILGLSNQEIDEKLDQIIKFSELEDFIDSALGSYSAGMKMRLGFSVAIAADFDILLIDECLLVGDVAFQEKCFKVLNEYKNKNKTMIFASQSLETIIKLCDRVLLLENGEVVFSGNPDEAVDRYRKLLNEQEFSKRKNRQLIRKTKRWVESMSEWDKVETTDKIKINSVETFNKWGRKTNEFKSKEKIKVKISLNIKEEIKDVHIGLALFREDGVYCYGVNSRLDGYRVDLYKGKGIVGFEYKRIMLAPGEYCLSVAVWEKGETAAYAYHRGCYKITITGKETDLLNLPFKWKNFNINRYFFAYTVSDMESLSQENKKSYIKRVELIDNNGKVKTEVMTGERASLEVDLSDFSLKNAKLQIDLIRSDGVLCQRFVSLLKPFEKEVILLFDKLRLLPGEYNFSVGIISEDKKLVNYIKNGYKFNVVFTREDHGTIYLSHKWKFKLPKGKVK